jgi:hypothetical protein
LVNKLHEDKFFYKENVIYKKEARQNVLVEKQIQNNVLVQDKI